MRWALVRHHGSCDPDRPFEPWMRGVVRNCCHDLRTRGARNVVPFSPEGHPPEPAAFERALDLDRTAARAIEAFRWLTPRQREVFDLCDRRGTAPAEAAEQLGIAPGTVRALLHQARRALRKRLLSDRTEILELLGDA